MKKLNVFGIFNFKKRKLLISKSLSPINFNNIYIKKLLLVECTAHIYCTRSKTKKNILHVAKSTM